MTKAISDVDDCVEGMRKFTTEIFDTGVALAGYAVMLFVYDWRLALLSLFFTPVSYICAAWMKKPVQQAGAAYKKAAGALSAATLDRAQNAVTYRICDCESAMERAVPPEGGKPARGDVVLSHVTFGYGERPVLHDFSMTVRQGEQVTLVGRTGAGKSTVFKLLLGLYQPQAGSITIGGVDAAAIPGREWYHQHGDIGPRQPFFDGHAHPSPQ